MRRRTAIAILGVLGFALVLSPAAAADLRDEQALAERYAPVVRLVEQTEECGPGEPYEPMDVDRLFGERTVALRGPWNDVDLVKIAPTAEDLAGLYEYHLDFPGNPLEAGCGYELWARRITAGTPPTVYAHVATDAAFPGKLALQYWFFYAFNDFNNTHEGDWEMIQLVFDADDAKAALAAEHPVEVGYSSHEGAERAAWGDEKLEVVDGTHPVVFPAAGSHANKYTEALYVGSSADAGVGCDDTRGPHRDVRPVVRTIPSDGGQAADSYPWITFEGRWGELQRAFFNGPTGPNLKSQWTAPIEWAEGWRDRSYAVPTGGLLGTGATDVFCAGVERGSETLIRLLRNPAATLLTIAAVLGILAFAVVRATWTPVAPLRIAHRRSWGQILSASGRMYVARPGLFVGLGLLLVPIVLFVTVIQWLLVNGLDALGSVTGDLAGVFAYVAVVVGTTLTLLGLGLVQAATACALFELDAGRPVSPVEAYRLALRRLGPLLGALLIAVATWILLATSVVLLPIGIWLIVRWSLLAPAVELEDRDAVGALRRSAELVRRRWLRVGSLVGLGGLIALLAGPVVGALLIFVSNSSLALLNLVAGVVYAITLPFVALVTSYVYFDARVREKLEPRDVRRELPAETSLRPA
ncbi:MAG TPA: hypothetical protein VHR46_10850 [Gaiella sp.]|jgi:hypothetical protein|nr:hypothetical protein [Gaiella sp.]